MSRQSFSGNDFSGSVTLQNISANLMTIKRMMGWSTTAMSEQIGISDRHLDSLLHQSSNVTVLVLEKIAEGLGIPFLRLTGTRIVVTGHKAGADFLEELRKEPWQITNEDVEAPTGRALKGAAGSRKGGKAGPAGKTADKAAPATGMDALLQRIVSVQEKLTKDQSATSSKVDKLADQVQDLANAVRGKAEPVSGATGRGPKGPRKTKEVAEEVSEAPRRRRGAARSAEPAGSSRTATSGEGDLFDLSAPETPKRRGRRPAAEGGSRAVREAALKSRGHESVRSSKSAKGSGPKRPYTRKK